MRQSFLFLLLFLVGLCPAPVRAERHYLLNETFRNVRGNGTSEIVFSQFDHPEGWTFTKAYAHDGGIIIRKGGTVTTPPLAELTGNASVCFAVEPWLEDTKEDFDPFGNPLQVSINVGELSATQYDPFTTMSTDPHMYGVNDKTRVTLMATYDIRLSGVDIYYANESGLSDDYLTKCSHEPGNYFAPFDLTLHPYEGSSGIWGDMDVTETDSRHNITVYTLDGSTPTRRSTRYDGKPLRIAGNTTLTVGTIFGNGNFIYEKPRVYTFPADEKPDVPENIVEVNVTEPGSLSARLLDVDADIIESLRVKGRLGSADLVYLAAAEGRVAAITYLDLSGISLDYDGGQYASVADGPEAGMGFTYYYNYRLSADNYDEVVGSRPTSKSIDCHRNDLSALFRRNRKLRTIILPDMMEHVGEYMLSDCDSLREVVFPKNVKTVGKYAFYHSRELRLYDFPTCLDAVGAYAFAYTRLGRITFDKPVRLGAGAFAGSTLSILDMPLPPDTIPDYAFDAELTEVHIGQGLEYIGQHAFGGKISVAELPSTIREIRSAAFADDCPFLLAIEPEGGIRYIGAVAYSVAGPDLPAYTLRPGTVSVSDRLFDGSSATSFSLPASLEIVGEEAFARTQITAMPAMPGLKRIGANAFYGCQKLARVEIPETVESIGLYAFYDCPALWSVTYNAVDARCEYWMFGRSIECITLGDKVRRVPTGLFTRNTGLTEVALPKSVEVIDRQAFDECSSLRSVSMPDGVIAIAESAFSNCSSLTGFHWPLRLKSVGEQAFLRCKSLPLISLPEGVEHIGDRAFLDCEAVEGLYIPSTIRTIGEGALQLFNKGLGSFTVMCTATTPPDLYWEGCNAPAVIKVPAEALEAYLADGNWNNAPYDTIIPIAQLPALAESSSTIFADAIDAAASLADTIVGDVYVTLGGAGGYDPADGSLVLASAVADEQAEAIGGLAPGRSDLHNRFDGLVVRLNEGFGSITVDCRTIGAKRLGVKIGTGRPQAFEQTAKGYVQVKYDVPEETYAYIYAVEAASPATVPSSPTPAALAADDCVKVYAVSVRHEGTGIGCVTEQAAGRAPVTAYYTLDGRRVAAPLAPGTYVVRRSDGSGAKIIVR